MSDLHVITERQLKALQNQENKKKSFLNKALGAASGIGGLGLGINKVLSNGYKAGAIGDTVSSIGSTVGGALKTIPGLNIAGTIVDIGSGVVGGGINALWGTKNNANNIAKVESSIFNKRAAANSLAAAKTVDSYRNAARDISSVSGFGTTDLVKGGLFAKNRAAKKGQAYLNRENNAFAMQGNAAAMGADNVYRIQRDNIMANFAALGGPIEEYESIGPATDWGLNVDRIIAKNQQAEAKDKFTSPVFNTLAKGGKINIKHPGRLTALKKRTGKTEAQLWAEGNPDVRKMITFARNARKWKKAYGGFLDASNNLFAEGGLKDYPVEPKDGTIIDRATIDARNTYVGLTNEQRRKKAEEAIDYIMDREIPYISNPDIFVNPFIKRKKKRKSRFIGYDAGRMERHKAFEAFPENKRKEYEYGGPLFALGGDVQMHGGDFSDGSIHVDAGGSHEENPYQGVQLGVDQEGTPNLVEEGEVVYNDYVYSKRIKLDRKAKLRFKISRGKDITYADEAKKLEAEVSERPNDPISKAAFRLQMEKLAEEQERQKTEMAAKEAQQAFEALSPEEQVAVMQNMAAQEQQAQAEQQQVMQEQAMQEQADMQEQATQMGAMPDMMQGQPVQQNAEGYGVPNVVAYGGKVNRFDDGGFTNWWSSHVPDPFYPDRDDSNANYYPPDYGKIYKYFFPNENEVLTDSAVVQDALEKLYNSGANRELFDAFDYGKDISGESYADGIQGGFTANATPIETPTIDENALNEAAQEQESLDERMYNVGNWKIPVSDAWNKYTKVGLKNYLEDVVKRIERAPTEEEKNKIRIQAIKDVQAVQTAYNAAYGPLNPTAPRNPKVGDLQDTFNRYNGNAGFGDVDSDIEIPAGAEGRDSEESKYWDRLWGPRNYIRNWGTTEYGDAGYYQDIIDLAKQGGLVYGPNEDWRYLGEPGQDTPYYLYGLSFPDEEANISDSNGIPAEGNDAASTPAQDNANPVGDTQQAQTVSTRQPARTPQNGDVVHVMDNGDELPGDQSKWSNVGEVVETRKMDNGTTVMVHKPARGASDNGTYDKDPQIEYKKSYFGLGDLGPITALAMQGLGIGKPDRSGFYRTLNEANKNRAIADYVGIGDYLPYKPMDVMRAQNRADATATAINRALANAAVPKAMKNAGLIANGYNQQMGIGELYKQALEYNDTMRKQAAEFNRGTNQFNAEAYNKTALANAELRNKHNQFIGELGFKTNQQLMDAENMWNQSIYGNINNLFKGLGAHEKENRQGEFIASMANNGIFGQFNEESPVFTNNGWRIKNKNEKSISSARKSEGGKINRKKRRGGLKL